MPAVINYSKTLKRKDIKDVVKGVSDSKYAYGTLGIASLYYCHVVGNMGVIISNS